MDGLTPDCQAGRDCLVPPLEPAAHRILELRGLIIGLRGLIDPGTVCRLYGIDLDDLRLLADVENLINELNPQEAQDDG